MGRDGRMPSAHNRRPQKTPMRAIQERRRRRKTSSAIRDNLRRPWEER